MSYLQLTTKCNMLCSHCLFACTAEGEDMSIATFRNALNFLSNYMGIEYVALGGGEPTIHPKFESMLFQAMSQFDFVWLATNGKHKRRALMLAELSRKYKDRFSAELSLDDYHEPIDKEVEEAFFALGRHEDSKMWKGIRTTTHANQPPIKNGRATEGRDECCCESLFITPSGDIKNCGCDDSPVIGNVNDPSTYSDAQYDFKNECCGERTNQLKEELAQL